MEWIKQVRVPLFCWELNSKNKNKKFVATDTNSYLLRLRKCKESSLQLNKQVGACPKDGVSVLM